MITIHHTADGTTVEGTERGDGTAAILKAHGFRWGRSITAWYLPRAWHETTRLAAAERVARALGDRAELVTGEDASTASAEDVPTYRERRLAKAGRLQGWAEKRQETATAALNSHPEIRHDWAFITQPGRIPARDRMNASDERAFKSLQKAEDMASRAAGIEAAAEAAIYSDDPDAIEQLEARIAGLEAKREQMKARNAEYRKEHKTELKELTAYGRDQAMPYPSYALTNLSGNINRQKKRLEQLKREVTS